MSVFDPFSVRSAEMLGHEVGMLGGSVAAMTLLGAPDVALITSTELADLTRRLTRAAPGFPVLVDADHGYGNALNVFRTVGELEHAGAAGATIEDTLLPAAFSRNGAELISIEEGVAKIQAALAARNNPEFVVVGRTAAARITDIQDAVRRASAYQATGADAIFLQGVVTKDDLDIVSRAISVPIILGGLADALADSDLLASRGVRLVVKGHRPFVAGVEAVHAQQWAEKSERSSGTPLAGEVLLSLLRKDEDISALVRTFL